MDTEGVGCDMSCFPRRPHGLQPRFEVFSEDFNDNGGFVAGTHFLWGYKRSLFFVVCKRSLLAGYAKN